MQKSLGLALGSGGARGVAHIGFLRGLKEEGIVPDYIAGCSMGAVVGGLYSSGTSLDELEKFIKNVKRRDIITLSPVPLTQRGLLKNDKITDLLNKYLVEKQIENFKIPFRCVATDLLSGKLHVFESGDAITAIAASSAIPSIFRPVKFEDKLLIDGGCLCRVPIREVKDMGADVVIALDVLKNTSEPVEKVSNIISVLFRTFDIMDSAVNRLKLNENKNICDLYLEPPMTGLSQYHVRNLDKAYNEGYETAKANMEKIKKLLN